MKKKKLKICRLILSLHLILAGVAKKDFVIYKKNSPQDLN